MPLANDLNANDVDGAKLAAPTLLLQGSADALVPAVVTAALARDLCASTPKLTYSAYPGATHFTIVSASLKEAQTWIGARFAGQPPTSNCGRL
jgi:alpha-beta hydrolase superfamily lysophospholipase